VDIMLPPGFESLRGHNKTNTSPPPSSNHHTHHRYTSSLPQTLQYLDPCLVLMCRGPLEVLEAGAVEMVLPLMRAVVERGEALLQRMHDQGFGKEGAATASRASPHIQELCRHLSHSRYLCETGANLRFRIHGQAGVDVFHWKTFQGERDSFCCAGWNT